MAEEKLTDLVSTHGLKVLAPDHVWIGVVSRSGLNAEQYDSLHSRATTDLLRLVNNYQDRGVKLCAVLPLDNNPVTALVQTVLRTQRVPVHFLTSSNPDVADGRSIWYVNDLNKMLVKSCTLMINYENEDLVEFVEDQDLEEGELEVIERSIPVVGEREFQNLKAEDDPYAAFWANVTNRLRIQRMAYQGIRLNQIIDVRPPAIP